MPTNVNPWDELAESNTVDSGTSEHKINSREYTDYIPRVFSGQDIDEQRAQAQSTGEKWLNGFTRVLPDLGLGLAEGVGYLGAFATSGSVDSTINNGFSTMMKEASESLHDWAPIYKTKAEQSNNWIQNLGTASFWAEEGLGMLVDVASLMIPGAGAGVLAGKSARAIGKAFATASRASKLAKGEKVLTALNQGMNTAKWAKNSSSITAALVSRTMENSMEAGETYNGLVADLTGKINNVTGEEYTPEEIKQIASEGAAATFRLGYALTFLEVAQMKTLFGGIKQSREAFKAAAKTFGAYGDDPIKQAIKGIGGESLEKAGAEAAEKAAKMGILNKVGNTVGAVNFNKKDLLFNILGEAGEENFQLAIQDYSKNYAKEVNGEEKELVENFVDYLSNGATEVIENIATNFTTDEGQKAMALGGLGGGVFGTAGEISNRKQEDRKLSQLKSMAVKTATLISEYSKQELRAAYLNDTHAYNKAKADKLTLIAWNMFEQGRGKEMNEIIDLLAQQTTEDLEAAGERIDNNAEASDDVKGIIKGHLTNFSNVSESSRAEQMKGFASKLEEAYNGIQAKFDYSGNVKMGIFMEHANQLVLEEQIVSVANEREGVLKEIGENSDIIGLQSKIDANKVAIENLRKAREKNLITERKAQVAGILENKVKKQEQDLEAMYEAKMVKIHGKEAKDTRDILRHKIISSQNEFNELEGLDANTNPNVADMIHERYANLEKATSDFEEFETTKGRKSLAPQPVIPRLKSKLTDLDRKAEHFERQLQESYDNYNGMTDPSNGEMFFNEMKDRAAKLEAERVQRIQKNETDSIENLITKAGLQAMEPATALGLIKSLALSEDKSNMSALNITNEDIIKHTDALEAAGKSIKFETYAGLLIKLVKEYNKHEETSLPAQAIRKLFIDLLTGNNKAEGFNRGELVVNEFKPMKGNSFKGVEFNHFIEILKHPDFESIIDQTKLEKIEVKSPVNKTNTKGGNKKTNKKGTKVVATATSTGTNIDDDSLGEILDALSEEERTTLLTDIIEALNNGKYFNAETGQYKDIVDSNGIIDTESLASFFSNIALLNGNIVPKTAEELYKAIVNNSQVADQLKGTKPNNEIVTDWFLTVAGQATTEEVEEDSHPYRKMQIAVRALLLEKWNGEVPTEEEIETETEEEVEDEEKDTSGGKPTDEEKQTPNWNGTTKTEPDSIRQFVISETVAKPKPGRPVDTENKFDAGTMVLNNPIRLLGTENTTDGSAETVTLRVDAYELAMWQEGKNQEHFGDPLNPLDIPISIYATTGELLGYVSIRYNASENANKIKEWFANPTNKGKDLELEILNKGTGSLKSLGKYSEGVREDVKSTQMFKVDDKSSPIEDLPVFYVEVGKKPETQFLYLKETNPELYNEIIDSDGNLRIGGTTNVLPYPQEFSINQNKGRKISFVGEFVKGGTYALAKTPNGKYQWISLNKKANNSAVPKPNQFTVLQKAFEHIDTINDLVSHNWTYENPQVILDFAKKAKELEAQGATNKPPVNTKRQTSKAKATASTRKTAATPKTKTTAKRETVTDKLKNQLMKDDPQTVYEAVLEYFARGGRISSDSMVKLTGNKGQDVSNYLWAVKKSAPSIDRLITDRFGYTHLFDQRQDSEVLKAIEDVLFGAGTLNEKIQDVLDQRDPETKANKEQSEKYYAENPNAKAEEELARQAKEQMDALKANGMVGGNISQDEDYDDVPFMKQEGTTGRDKINLDKAKAELTRMLPNVGQDTIDKLATVLNKDNAWGAFKNGVIYLSENAEQGVEYHEAFHAVFRSFLSDKESNNLLKTSGLTEEQLAEKFRVYSLAKQDRTLIQKVRDFFNQLLELIGIFKTNKSDLDILFEQIYNGDFGKANLVSNRFTKDVSKFQDDVAFMLLPGLTANLSKRYITEYANFIVKQLEDTYDGTSKVTNREVLNNAKATFLNNLLPATRELFITHTDIYSPLLERGAIDMLKDNKFKIDDLDRANLQVSNRRIQEKNYDANPNEYSMEESMGEGMRRILRFTMYTDGAFQRPIEYSVVYATIQRLCADKPHSEIIPIVEKLAETNPQVKAVFDKIMSLSVKDPNIIIRFKHAVSSSMNIHKVSTRTTKQVDIGDDTTVTEYVSEFNDANKDDVVNTLMASWESNFRAIFLGKEGAGKLKTAIANNLNIAMRKVEKAIPKQRKRTKEGLQTVDQFNEERIEETYNALIEHIKPLYDSLGITLTDTFYMNLSESGRVGEFFALTEILSKHGLKRDNTGSAKDAYLVANPFVTTSEGVDKRIRELAKLDVVNHPDTDVFSPNFRSVDDKTKFAYSQHSGIRTIINELQADNSERLAEFKSDIFLGGNIMLKDVNSHLLRDMRYRILEGIEIKGSDNPGVASKDTVEKDWITLVVDAYFNSNATDIAYYPTPQPSDKSTIGAISLPKYKMFNKKVGITKTAVDLFYNIFKQEEARINKAYGEISDGDNMVRDEHLIENYHYKEKINGVPVRFVNGVPTGNALKFCHLPFMNTLLIDPTTGLIRVDIDESTIRKHIANALEGVRQNTLALLTEYGIIEKSKENYKNKILDSRIGNIENFVSNFAINSFFATDTIYQLTAGDLAQTKIFAETQESKQARKKDPALPAVFDYTITDAIKRYPMVYAYGTSLLDIKDSNGQPKVYYNLAIAESVYSVFDKNTLESVVSEVTNAAAKSILSVNPNLQKVEVADGMEFCTFERYIEILQGIGKKTPQVISFLDKIKNGQDVTIADVPFSTVKGVYYGLEMSNKEGREGEFTGVKSIYVKSSLVPLIPSWINRPGNGRLKALNAKMIASSADHLAFESAVKTGKQGVTSILNPNDTRPLPTIKLKNSNWRLQVDLPYKPHSQKIPLGVQIQRIIDSYIDMNPNAVFEIDGQEYDYQEVRDLHNKMLAQSVTKKLNDIKGKLYKDNTIDDKELSEALKDHLQNMGVSENRLEYLATKIVNGVNKFVHSPDLPNNTIKMEEMIVSFFNNEVLEHKVPGIKTSLVSSIFQTVNDNGKFRPLKYVAPERDADGNITKVGFAEVILPHFMKEYFEKQGIFNIQDIPQELLEMVGFRIPTQGHNSMFHFKVAGFLDAIQGNMAIVPPQVSYVAGSDFDADSLFIIRPDYYARNINGKIEYTMYKYREDINPTNIGAAYDDYIEHEYANNKTVKKIKRENLTSINALVNQRQEEERLLIAKANKGNAFSQTAIIGDTIVDINTKPTTINDLLDDNGDIKEEYKDITIEYLLSIGVLPTEEIFATYSVANQNTNAARYNKVLGIYKGILSNPNVLQFMAQNPEVDALEEQLQDEKETTNLPFGVFGAQFDSRMNNLAGKNLISVVAVEAAAKATLQKLPNARLLPVNVGTKEKPVFISYAPIFIDERGNKVIYNDFTRIATEEGKLISSEINALLSAVVDNANNPLAKFANLTMETTMPLLKIITLGGGMKNMVLLGTQPVIKELSKRVNRTRSKITGQYTGKDLLINHINDLIKETDAELTKIDHTSKPEDIQGKIGNIPIRTTDLQKAKQLKKYFAVQKVKGEKRDKTLYKEYLQIQRDALISFRALVNLDKQIKPVIDLTRLDGDLPPVIRKVLDLYADSTQLTTGKGNLVDNNSLSLRVLSDNEYLMANLEVLKEVAAVSENYFTNTTSFYKIVYSRLAALKGGDLTDRQYRRIDAFVRHHFLGKAINATYTRERAMGLLYDGSKDKSLKERIQKELENNTVFRKNSFIRKLKFPERENGIGYIEYNNMYKTTPEQENDLVDSFMELYSYNSGTKEINQRVRQIAKDLILYSFITTGFEFKGTSFVKGIPSTLMEGISKKLYAVGDLLRKNIDKDSPISDELAEDRNIIIDNFIRHHKNSPFVKVVKKAVKLDDTTIQVKAVGEWVPFASSYRAKDTATGSYVTNWNFAPYVNYRGNIYDLVSNVGDTAEYSARIEGNRLGDKWSTEGNAGIGASLFHDNNTLEATTKATKTVPIDAYNDSFDSNKSGQKFTEYDSNEEGYTQDIETDYYSQEQNYQPTTTVNKTAVKKQAVSSDVFEDYDDNGDSIAFGSGPMQFQKDSQQDTVSKQSLVNTLNTLAERFGISWKEDNTMSALGRFENGVVYINLSKAKADTPFHEFTHPFIELISKTNPELFSSLVNAINERTDILDKVKANYPELANASDKTAFYKEAIVQAIGEQAARLDNTSTLGKLIQLFLKHVRRILNSIRGIKEELTPYPINGSIMDLAKFMAKGGNLDLSGETGVFEQREDTFVNTQKDTIETLDETQKNIILGEVVKTLEEGESESRYITKDGQELERVTAWLSDFDTDTFDSDAAAKRLAPNDPEGQQKLKDKWKATTEIGTEVHSVLSQITNGVGLSEINSIFPFPVVENIHRQFEAFKRKYGIKNKLLTEYRVGNSTLNIGGSIDLIEVMPNGRVKVYDFKCSFHSTEHENYKKDFGKKFKEPLGLGKSKFNKHSLQLNVYKRLLELGDKSLGLKRVIVESLAVIPIKINLNDNFELKSVGFEKMQPVATISKVRELLKVDEISLEELTDLTQGDVQKASVKKLIDFLEKKAKKIKNEPNKSDEYALLEEQIAKLLARSTFTKAAEIATANMASIQRQLASVGDIVELYDVADLNDWVKQLRLYSTIGSIREAATDLLITVEAFSRKKLVQEAFNAATDKELRGINDTSDITKNRPDMHKITTAVASIANTDHEVIQLINRELNRKNQFALNESIEWQQKLDIVMDAVKKRYNGGANTIFKPFIQLDKNDKPTGLITQKNTAEFWKDASKIHKKDRAEWVKNNKDNVEYQDPNYKIIKDSKELSDFYELWNNFMQYARTTLMPDEYMKAAFIPYLAQDILETASKNGLLSSVAQGAKGMFNFIEKDNVLTAEDSEYGTFGEEGAANRIPVYGIAVNSTADYKRRYKELMEVKEPTSGKTYKDLMKDEEPTAEVKAYAKSAREKAYEYSLSKKSYDLDRVFRVFSTMAIKKKYLQEAEPLIELAQDYLNNEVNQETGTVNKNRASFFKEHIERELYGVTKKKEFITLFGYKFRYDKFFDKLMNLTSVSRMALNPSGGLGNAAYASITNRIEGAGGEFYDAKDYKAAMAMYWDLALSGKLFSDDNIHSLLIQRYNIAKGMTELESGSKSKLKPKIGMDAAFWFQNVGEKYMQGAVMLAMLKRKGWLEKYDVVNGALVWKEGADIPTPEEEADFIATVKGVTEYLHGRYDKRSMAVAQKYVVGRVFYLFHKWVVPALEARGIHRYYNATLHKELEGRYITLVKFAGQLKKLKGMAEAWDSLDNMQKANMKKNFRELLYLGAVIAAASLLVLDEDDEDKTLKLLGFKKMPNDRGFSATAINRLLGDMTLWYNPFRTYDVFFQAPAMSSTISDFEKLITDSYEPYKSGAYSGYNKAWVRLASISPGGGYIKQVLRSVNNTDDE